MYLREKTLPKAIHINVYMHAMYHFQIQEKNAKWNIILTKIYFILYLNYTIM